MLNNITSMFSHMNDESKELAVSKLSEEFGVTERTVRENWIAGRSVPKKHQPFVVGIFQGVLIAQNEKTKQFVK